MHQYFATLCDARYLKQALALYESLRKHSSETFTLYVLAMDIECANILTTMALPGIQLVLGFHETHRGMKEARANRTHAEYCFTCSSALCEALLETGLSEITYLDSDCWFMADPKIAFDEIGERSIGIIPHRFADNADRPRLEKAGRFNVSLVHFKNTPVGRACVTKWADQCRAKCSVESYGDQLYLQNWPEEYGSECAIVENPTVGVAPWNLSSYAVTGTDHVAYIDGKPVCMYHFHETRFREDGTVHLTNYRLRNEDRQFIYAPYIRAVESAKFKIHRAIEKERAHA